MKTIYLAIVLSLYSSPSKSATPPPAGAYRFTQPFTIEGCIKYAGGRGIDPNCVQTRKETFQPNRIIWVSEFFWDDAKKEFGAKIIFAAQNRSVPMNYLEKTEIPKSQCKPLESQYLNHVAGIDRSCKSATDCTLSRLAWDSCSIPISIQKAALDREDFDALAELRTLARNTCGAVDKPCPAITTQPICDLGKCSTVEGFFREHTTLKLQLIDAKDSKPIANHEVTVLNGDIIYCAVAPCPEGRSVRTLKSDSQGYIELKREFLSGKISIRIAAVNGGKSPPKALEEVKMEDLLSLSEHKIRF